MDNSYLKERNFEEDIEQWLLDEGGYERGFQMTYNKDEAIDLTALIDFITETQPKEWARYQKIYGGRMLQANSIKSFRMIFRAMV